LHWSSLGSEDGEEFSVPTVQNSRELLNALPLLESMLTYLDKTLPRQTFLRIFKHIANDLQAHLWEWMITAHRFSAPGGLLFARDMYALWECCRPRVPSPEQYMKRLHDAVVLLSLPSSLGVAPMTGEITLASVTKRLRDTAETDIPRITELKDWLAVNVGVKTLSLAEVLYMFGPLIVI
jgi:RINT-1 / TIP-1 family